MAHTAGFEDLHVGMVTLNEAEITPQGAWLASNIPARVLPPGEVPAYSNYGAALAGYIVARVSGESYSQYVQRHILDPLGMRNSTAQWPTPQQFRARESVGYTYTNGTFQVFPRLYGPTDLFAVGALESTVTDMARFMIAHLQNGRYSDAALSDVRILKESTALQMHSPSYVPMPGMLGTDHGFFEFSDNGQRVIGHGGEAEPMQSTLFLLPDQNLGVFVTYNSAGASGLTDQHRGFQRAFFDHYYPAPAVERIQPPADFAQRADQFVGAYRWTRHSYTTLEKYSALFAPTLTVENPGDGTLLVKTPWDDLTIVEEAPLLFRQVDGPFKIAFRQGERGRITYMFTDLTPQFAFEKVHWYETVALNTSLLLSSLLLFLTMLPVALVRGIRIRRTNDLQGTPRSARLANALIVIVSLFNLLFVAGNAMWGEQIVFGISPTYQLVLGLGVFSALLTIGAVIYVVLAWKSGYWSVAFRLYYTLITLGAVAFLWFIHFWNLLGWRY